MTEMVAGGYHGPIIMTPPTKAICPILLEDYRKITVDRKGETNFFNSEMIHKCMEKVVTIGLHETFQIGLDLEIKCYYAGHVLGAGMFLVRCNGQSVLYTGDYNMTPDRHLGAAKVDRCLPDVLITESTYATTIRDSKRCRERDFLTKVHDCVKRGGKVLIPVFALGRAQELCILLDTYWERMNIKVPIYFTQGLTEKATNFYKLFIGWTNEKIRDTFVDFNMFDFKHITTFNHSYLNNPGPMVVFATPGMLHGGTSLQIFKRWAGDAKNMIIMPGYCVSGTVGARLLNGEKKIEMDNQQTIDVCLDVEYMSFSAHADAKGIMQLIRNCQPRHVVLVHGEAQKMRFLKAKIGQELALPCDFPMNGETIRIACDARLPALIWRPFLKKVGKQHEDEFFGRLGSAFEELEGGLASSRTAPDAFPIEGVFIIGKDDPENPGSGQQIRIYDRDSASRQLAVEAGAEEKASDELATKGRHSHAVRLRSEVSFPWKRPIRQLFEAAKRLLRLRLSFVVIDVEGCDGSASITDSCRLRVGGIDVTQAPCQAGISNSMSDDATVALLFQWEAAADTLVDEVLDALDSSCKETGAEIG